MRDDNIRLAIAGACGWTKIKRPLPMGDKQWCYTADLPDYLNDLNACHEMEGTLTEAQYIVYGSHLWDVLCIEKKGVRLWHATARQRCEAFLKTIGKWSDE